MEVNTKIKYPDSSPLRPSKKLLPFTNTTKHKIVKFSKKMEHFDKRIKNFLKKKMYNNKNVKTNTLKGKKIIRKLFYALKKNPKKYIDVGKYNNSNIDRSICDFIPGMTNRYAKKLNNKLK